MAKSIMTSTSWRVLLDKERHSNSDTSTLIIYPENLDLDKGFEKVYGTPSDFGAWSETHVYFPICYQGAIGVASVPRHPVASPIDVGM